MELKKALKRVVKMTSSARGEALYRYIRFLPGEAESGIPPRVFARDLDCMSLIPVDRQVPNVFLDSTMLKKALAEPGEWSMELKGMGKTEIRVGEAEYKLHNIDYTSHPTFPDIPTEFKPVSGFDSILKVVHAASADRSEAFGMVNFADEWVEATDRSRFARVYFPGFMKGLVPSRLFKNWPSGAVQVAVTPSSVFFLIGDELRIAMFNNGKYPDTRNMLGESPADGFILVETDALVTAVKQATKVSPLNLISLEFTDKGFGIAAWVEEDKPYSFWGSLDVVQKSNVVGKALVSGKYLEQALKPVITPNVVLRYGSPVDPLSVESGNYVACIWQMQ